ncbi:hypothetical protein CEP54_003901 [Fusarium duplospermum]|uniref:Uncharacterized protein n=1 Tax=Fusarium duplospermum TaxID=1325734 RepID=A0A428QLJ1_9HYPO|nr:hypothetical protein CEP54_003901 [Fusarium duplospermum]
MLLETSDLSETYSFTIYNKSDLRQSYTLFSKAPDVEPAVEHITSHAILVARGIPPGDGIATFVIQSNGFYAICGSMYQDEAVQMYALDRKPVRLGTGIGASAKAGTTCVLKASPDNPCSGSLVVEQGEGKLGSFCLKTGVFHYKEAQSNGYIVALGLSTAPNTHVGVHASFIPSPRTAYQITPSKIYYIVPSAFRANEAKPDEVDLSKAVQVDFSTAPRDVQIIHDNENKLSIFSDVPLPTPKL